jgi:hypothetical protein
MGYELGLNWSGYTEKVGAILGPLLTYETMTAFFLEAGFLGVMLFGMKRVGPRLHFAATCAVAFGTHLSAFWILAGNSWMQTPQGYKIVDGRFVPTDWLAIIFNPSMPYRFVHMMGAAYLSVALMVGAVGAWHVLHDRKNDIARLMLSMALWMVLFAAPCQIVAGDVQGDNTLRYQPQKIAAMEGDWVQPAPGAGEPLVLFAIPHMKSESNSAAIEIPRVASWYLTHTWSGTIKGLREFGPDDIPYVPIVFFAFRVMVGLGLLMLALAVVGAFLRRRGVLYDTVSCDAGGMDRHRDGPPALHRLWAAADDQQRLSDRHAGRRRLARGFRRGVRGRFRRGADFLAPFDGEGARARRAGRAEPPAPQRRHRARPGGGDPSRLGRGGVARCGTCMTCFLSRGRRCSPSACSPMWCSTDSTSALGSCSSSSGTGRIGT